MRERKERMGLVGRLLYRHKNRPRSIPNWQAADYLGQSGLSAPLVVECMNFLESMAYANGEQYFIGEKTIRQITDRDWVVSEAELELMYRREPSRILGYVDGLYLSPDMPSELEITAPIAAYSPHAKCAYIFLTEAISRMVYGIRYDNPKEFVPYTPEVVL